jgi:4-amino-4-deoxy-L-arabinose transferase-like glycosyltransferase
MTETTAASPRDRDLAAAAQGKWPTTSWFVVSVLLLLLMLVALRCWVAARMDFEADEAYYWLWSRHLAISYYDHPPMVAYLTRLGTWLAGDGIFGVRCMAALTMVLTSVLLYTLAVTLFAEPRIGLLTVLWFNVTLHATVFSIIMSPDTPAVLFWVLACVGLALVWRTERGGWWYLVGIAIGLLLLSKYTGFFLGLGIVAWLAASAQMRPWLKRHQPYVAGLIALLLFSPVILWNAQHGWISFAKQFGRALDTAPHASVIGFIGDQAGFISPLIFAFVIAALGLAIVRGFHRQEANWLLVVMTSVPILLYFFVHSVSSEVLTQWPSAAYPAAIAAAVAAFAARADDPRWHPVLRYSFHAAPWVGLAAALLLCVQMALTLLPIPAAKDPLSRFFGWAGLSSDTRAIARAQQAGYITASDYCTISTLAFYLREVAVFPISETIRYVSLPPLDQALLNRATGIYVEARGFDGPARLREHFTSVELISTTWRARNGDPIEPYRIYLLKGYRGGLPVTGRLPPSAEPAEC